MLNDYWWTTYYEKFFKVNSSVIMFHLLIFKIIEV